MSDTKKEEARRRVLKKLAIGGGLVSASKLIPENWKKPVVDSVVLPAHAEVSENVTQTGP